jgi:2,4-dienoyl-CoA reductase-like NADH-dependent reductase (Old Yellow Enzyme family)/thioredoxin reductase
MAEHTTNFGLAGPAPADDAGTPGRYQRNINYYRERARGGVGLIITESVRMYKPLTSGRKFNATHESAVHDLSLVTDAVKSEGAVIFAQLNEPGRHLGGTRRLDRPLAIAPSPIPWSPRTDAPHQLLTAEILDLVKSFGPGTARLEAAGFDGLELQLAHGHLLQQFLSPASNSREDAYGGAPERRLRFVRDVIAEIRNACGLPLGVRVSGDEFLPNGLKLDDMLAIVDDLHAQFDLAFVNVSHSSYVDSYTLSTQVADMTFPPTPFLHFARAFKQAFPSLPVITTCRVDDLGVADRLIGRGDADLVGMARPLMADAELVRKAAEGRSDSTTRCIACNQGCAGRLEEGLPISCVVNPTMGVEGEWRVLDATPRHGRRSVAVVGAGPAGLKAAATAARYGHAVTLFEKDAEVGGQIRHAAALRGRDRFILLVEDLLRSVEMSGVDIVTARTVTTRDVLDGRWDEVIIATGAASERSRRIGELSTTPIESAIATPESLGRAVIVRDLLGTWEGAGLAEHLAGRGIDVTLVVPHGEPAHNVTVYSRNALLKRLGEMGVEVECMRDVASATLDEVTLVDTVSGRTYRKGPVSGLVEIVPRSARDALVAELSVAGFAGPLWLVGDAYQPRTSLDAVYEGQLAGAAVGVGDFEPLFRFSGFRPPVGILPANEQSVVS